MLGVGWATVDSLDVEEAIKAVTLLEVEVEVEVKVRLETKREEERGTGGGRDLGKRSLAHPICYRTPDSAYRLCSHSDHV